jgi:murein DD-endopeptidase MepM/ murein hydrolase activator NlpD
VISALFFILLYWAGKVGSTGHVRKKIGRDASHLHFEIAAYGKKVNPLSFFM